MLRKFLVKKDERALLFRKGDFAEVLHPGEYAHFDPLKRLSVETFPLSRPEFAHRLADYLLKAEPELAAREFQIVELGESEVGLRYENGVLVEVLAPNTRRLYWKGHVDVRVERVNIAAQYALSDALLVHFATPAGRAKIAGADNAFVVQVPQYQVGLFSADGKDVSVLQPGVYAYWKFGRTLGVEYVDLRLQVLEVAGQEILTKDKVGLRINLSAGYRVSDVLTAFSKQAKPLDFLYKELQFGLRAAVGTRTLDELLENEVVRAHIDKRVAGLGLEVESVGVKDIILPGEMKTILAKVVEAEKAAQANVIRRREETAATRSLLNTAKVMEDNPVALRLKELETRRMAVA